MSASFLTEMVPSLADAIAARAFWDAHREELVERFAGKYVAAKDGEIIAADGDLAVLVQRLTDLGLDVRTDVALEFISRHPSTLLL